MIRRKAVDRPPKPDRSAEFASFRVSQPVCRMATPATVARAAVPVPKTEGFYSEPWRRAVASLPCVLCHAHGQTQAAHRNEGKAAGRKLMDDCWTAALCTTCHAEIDQGSQLSREDRRQRLDLAILLTIREMARTGLLKC